MTQCRSQEKAKKVNYTYIDNKGNKHGLGEWELIEADNYAKGTTTHIEADKCYSEYSNYYGKTIYYKRLKGKIKLVNIKDKKVDYENNEVCIMYQFKSSINRKYANVQAFASLIGALADLGAEFKDVTINGFTDKNGTGSPSITHPQGINFDIRLLNIDKKIQPLSIPSSLLDVDRCNKLMNSLYKFGYTQGVSNYYEGTKLLKNCVRDVKYNRHKDHLHIQGYKPNLEKR